METLFKKSLLFNSFASTREWRNGRRAGLRIQCRKAWGFKSPLSHFQDFFEINKPREVVCILTIGHTAMDEFITRS